MIYHFEQGTNGKTLILFHGTGGNEMDLVPLAKALDKDANILSFRGRVNEQGMNRFFKRISPGVFDLESLISETEYYLHRIEELAIEYQFDMNQVTLLGYSNGANIIGSMLFHSKDVFRKAILIRPMIPLKKAPMQPLINLKVLILSGIYDSLVSINEVDELKNMFEKRHASVELNLIKTGHQMAPLEIPLMKKFIDHQ